VSVDRHGTLGCLAGVTACLVVSALIGWIGLATTGHLLVRYDEEIAAARRYAIGLGGAGLIYTLVGASLAARSRSWRWWLALALLAGAMYAALAALVPIGLVPHFNDPVSLSHFGLGLLAIVCLALALYYRRHGPEQPPDAETPVPAPLPAPPRALQAARALDPRQPEE
jgi:hypothetical protein